MPTQAPLLTSLIPLPHTTTWGMPHARLGEGERAITAYQKAIALKPDFTDAYVALGTVLQSLKRTDEAITAYRQALAIKPDYAEAHYNLGSTLTEAGKFDEAVISFRLAIGNQTGLCRGALQLGNLYYGRPADLTRQ